MIAVCIPSRGLMHSRTMDDILRNVDYAQDKRGHFPVRYIFSHGRGQPEAQNYITEEALKLTGLDYICYIDDDMAIPEHVLDEMMGKDADVVTAAYPCTAHGSNALHIRDGKFESTGLGCVLLKPHVFKKLDKPYFRCDVDYTWNGEELESTPSREGVSRHGGHDVFFSQQLVKAGIIPSVIDTKLGQYNITNNSYRKYGNETQLNIEEWSLRP